MLDHIIVIDKAIFLFLNRDVANPAFDWFFLLITNGRNWVVPIVILSAVYLKVEKKRALIAIGLAIVAVSITDPVSYRLVKPFIHRFRPCHPVFFVEGGRFLLGHKNTLSFPSNHAANWFGQAVLFTFLYPKRWPWFFGPAVLVSYSRIYVGVHYPLDVAGGAVIGAVAGTGVGWGYLLADRRWFRAFVPHP
jgi:undecaprenyl-diphosphatase